MFLTDNTCHSSGTLAGKCRVYATDGGCRVCNDGFYRHEQTCLACDGKCRTCTDGSSCSTCSETHFMGVDGVCRSKGEIVGCSVEITSEHGCSECLVGYFQKDKVCTPCSMMYMLCAACTEEACYGCVADYVLSGGLCIHFTNITYCAAAGDSRCTKCSFWHAPTVSGDECTTRAVWWVVLLTVLVTIIIFFCAVASITCAVNVLFRIKQRWDVSRTVCIFAMRRSNVKFVKTKTTDVVTNVLCVDFEGVISVGVETKALLCVGNTGRRRSMVQVVGKDNNDRYTLRVVPDVVVLEHGMACEFEIFVMPLCSCTIDDKIAVVVRRSGYAETGSVYVGFKAVTDVTTKLHYDDIVCEKKIGEGSFGIVFKGIFRGHEVAVKKMKENGTTDEATAEFAKEVAMLDKFRCDQIVHFYGACTITNHVMLVTEFAPCGSLTDCIKTCSEPEKLIKAKLMLDAARGLDYLHSNGILHRDIKPDNVLVFSIVSVLFVNGKLTDFGSSRNINMLMTNMTFTKGIGTPVYMAPEVINKEKYKKPADVFSYGVMMYECFKWGDAYPRSVFKYPWDIVSFINAGKRLARPRGMDDEVYAIVSRCWLDEANGRISLLCFDLHQDVPSLVTELVTVCELFSDIRLFN